MDRLGEAARKFKIGLAGFAPDQIRVRRIGEAARDGLLKTVLGLEEAFHGAFAGRERLVVVVDVAGEQVGGFRVGTVASYPLKVRFTDMDDNVYTVFVREKFAKCTGPLSACPANRAQIVDKAACSVITPQGTKHPQSDTWCDNANPNQARDNDQAVVKNHLSYPKPVKWLP